MLRADLSLFPDYKPGKSDETKLKLSANEANFGPLPTALEAIRESALRANRYPISGSPVLRKALADRLGLSEEQVAVAPGASAVIQQAVLMTCAAGDEVLFPWRSFEAYPLYARVGGA
ncbi:MAG: aminotransferase, partial [Corynebacterium urealyticum]